MAASFSGVTPFSGRYPPVVGMSAVSNTSFTMTGMPWSGERAPFDLRSRSSARAVSIAFALSASTELIFGPLWS